MSFEIVGRYRNCHCWSRRAPCSNYEVILFGIIVVAEMQSGN